MEENSFNRSLKYSHISQATKEALEYIDNRRKGKAIVLKTPWNKMNKVLGGGLELHSIHSICGISGSGKTAIAAQLEEGLITLNDYPISILNFNFEMPGRRLIGRKIGAKLDKSVQELYSAEESLSDEYYNKAVEEAKKMNNKYVYYCEMPGTVEEIYNTIINFVNESFNKGRIFVFILDHALLTKGQSGEQERSTLYKLMAMFNAVKKMFNCITIILSQLNRDIESSIRLENPDLQYPRRSDLMGADSMYMYSDTVLIAHRPEMLGLTVYGRARLPTRNMVYLHWLKNRDGEPCVAAMVNDLAHGRIIDYIPTENAGNN